VDPTDDSPGEAPDDLPGPSTNTHGLELVRQLAITVGAPKAWQDFFVLVAQRESRGNPNVGRGTTYGAPSWVKISESKHGAAVTAYKSHEDEYSKCWPAPGYEFGSGGLYAMLPGYALWAFAGTELICLHPWVVFNPTISTIMAAHFAHRLTKWPSYKGTVISLRAGWGDPSKMGDTEYLATRRAKYRADAVKAGLDPDFVDSKLPSWKPLDAEVLFDALGADRGWLPE
jgi:hypothetical protein